MELKSRAELWKLFDLGDSAEIGVAEGLFSRDILAWGVKKLYLVDAWKELPQTGDGGFEQRWHDKNFRNVEKINNPRAQVLRGISWDMSKFVADQSLSFLYIDCCHTFDCVKRDLEAWFPKVKCGGLIAGHDYRMREEVVIRDERFRPILEDKYYPVQDAVQKFVNGRFEIKEIEENGLDASFYFIKTC